MAALLVALWALWVVGMRPAKPGLAQMQSPAIGQTLRYIYEGDRVKVEIETDRWFGEAEDEWQRRQHVTWKTWKATYEDQLEVDRR